MVDVPPVPQTPPQPDTPLRHLLSLICLGIAVVAIAVEMYVFYLAGSLIIFSYSGGGDPTSVNGLAFPVALFILALYGLPTAGVAALAIFGYQKTKPMKPKPTPQL